MARLDQPLAEAMTLFAVAMAALFPILHLGRPWFFYRLMPLPVTHILGRNGAARWSGTSPPSPPTASCR